MEQGLLLAVFSLFLSGPFTTYENLDRTHLLNAFLVFLGQNRASRQRVIAKRNLPAPHCLTCSNLSSKPTRHLVNSIA